MTTSNGVERWHDSAPATTMERLEREEKRLIIEECIAIIRETYEREPLDARDMRLKSDAWLIALEAVPAAELTDLTRRVLQTHTGPFMPTPGDLLHARHGTEPLANAAAYRPLPPTENQLAIEAGEVQRDTGGRAAFLELGRKLRQPRRAARDWREDPALRLTPATEHELGRALREWLDMGTWKLRHETWVAFGTWLLERYPVGQWTPELGREQWLLWQQGEGTTIVGAGFPFREARRPGASE
jgi:hypothetical protein